MPDTDVGHKDGVMVVRFAAATDVGMQRKNNEDASIVIEESCFCAVADGMGGHLGGEIASHIAIETLQQAFKSRNGSSNERKDAELLTKSIKNANKEIYRRGNSDAALRNMGTTIVAVVISGDYVVFANVGDSRIYRMREGELSQITEDHSWVGELRKKNLISAEDARSHPLKNIITRALGMEPAVEVDVKWEKVKAGDLFLLCSDGLTDLVPDEQIKSILLKHGKELEAATRDLVAAANAAGGSDNITVSLALVE
ncbi:Stp1/IreP family PP2C-type Ser/Thr phosphatase [bacterium]|nr:MAG: Stp1/IreP family PP2C-type Ser/Thr phosphatase [bacterium]RIK65040.1 MAG: Stp1/IreP family PP2C-type Ser/Thr phosphatase [Planctomycetota bacterium]